MAVIVANVAASPVAIFDYFHGFNLEASGKEKIAGGVKVILSANEYVEFVGNFVFDPVYNLLPISGTLTSVKAVKADLVQFSLTSLTLDVQTVYSYTSEQGGQGQEIKLAPIAFAGNDRATGSNFVDQLDGHNGNDTISGRAGNDTLNGMNGNDVLSGDDGNDKGVGGTGNDTLSGGNGSDVLFGGAGTDTLKGGNDNDNLIGDADADILFGDAGNDLVQGGTGDDKLNGGAGNDRMIGGANSDIFVFDKQIPAQGANTINVDRIVDFNVGNDIIHIDNLVFKGLATGALTAAAFRLGSKAADADDRIIYYRATGDFYFDANGNVGPSTGQVKFAHLDKAAGAALFPAVSLADLFVI